MLITEVLGEPFTPLANAIILESTIQDYDLQEMLNPQFELNHGRVHNWRNYVSEVVKAHWNELPIEARLVSYLGACQETGREEWD